MLVYTDVGAMVGQGEGCQRRQKGKGTGKREREGEMVATDREENDG